MRDDSPLFLQKVECPVCKAINEFETIKVGAYEEGERDTDFRPTGIKWNNPKYQKYNPILFFMATCSNCYFTREYTSKFKDWKNDTSFRNFKLKPMRERHTLHLTEDRSVIKEFGKRLDNEKYPLQTAINKLLIGIYDELLLERSSNLDVARYFVRIGWLFRECASSEYSEQTTSLGYASRLEEQIKELKAINEKLNGTRQELKTCVNNYLEETNFASEAITAELKKRNAQALAFLAGADERIESSINQFNDSLEISKESIVCNTDNGVFSTKYTDYASYVEFLKNLRESWEMVPVSEHDALGLSLRFYSASYEAGHEVSSGNQQIQVEYILGELSRRLGRGDEAKKYFNSAIRSAQEFIFHHKGDKSRTALARKIREMALMQGKLNLKEIKQEKA